VLEKVNVPDEEKDTVTVSDSRVSVTCADIESLLVSVIDLTCCVTVEVGLHEGVKVGVRVGPVRVRVPFDDVRVSVRSVVGDTLREKVPSVHVTCGESDSVPEADFDFAYVNVRVTVGRERVREFENESVGRFDEEFVL
jgi:hypothetical protein